MRILTKTSDHCVVEYQPGEIVTPEIRAHRSLPIASTKDFPTNPSQASYSITDVYVLPGLYIGKETSELRVVVYRRRQ